MEHTENGIRGCEPSVPPGHTPRSGGVANASGHRLRDAQVRSLQGSLLRTQQRLLAQALEALATGPCAQVMSQRAPRVVSTGGRGVELSGSSSGLEVRTFPGSSHSYHPLGHWGACLHPERGQEGFCFWWCPQDRTSGLTHRRVRAFDVKVCPFLPKAYLMEEIACPSKPCLTSILSPP